MTPYFVFCIGFLAGLMVAGLSFAVVLAKWRLTVWQLSQNLRKLGDCTKNLEKDWSGIQATLYRAHDKIVSLEAENVRLREEKLRNWNIPDSI